MDSSTMGDDSSSAPKSAKTEPTEPTPYMDRLNVESDDASANPDNRVLSTNNWQTPTLKATAESNSEL